jgi:hypothetical protein
MSLYGIVAEFDGIEGLVNAAHALKQERYTRLETYTPYPAHELDELIEEPNRLPAIVFTGGVLGAATAWSLQTYIAVYSYPLNVGGRPLYSWPSFIVIFFELTVLFAAIFAFVGALALSGLPRPHHPVFNDVKFNTVTRDGFFLCVAAADPIFDRQRITELLDQYDPVEVREVSDD